MSRWDIKKEDVLGYLDRVKETIESAEEIRDCTFTVENEISEVAKDSFWVEKTFTGVRSIQFFIGWKEKTE